MTCVCFSHRALVGDNTIGENYAFAGMHHIFDQHSKAGERRDQFHLRAASEVFKTEEVKFSNQTL